MTFLTWLATSPLASFAKVFTAGVLGQDFIASLGLNGEWKQTSYNGNFRSIYAGAGYTYDSVLDEFVSPAIVVVPEVEAITDAE